MQHEFREGRGSPVAPDSDYQTDESYSYDANGNGTNSGYDTGDNNQLLSDGTYDYQYDANGNRTKKTTISTGDYVEYAWDYRQRLTSVTFRTSAGVKTKQVAYKYDAFDRRIAKDVDDNGDGTFESAEHFIFDGINVVVVLDGSGVLADRMVYGPNCNQVLASENTSGDTAWMLPDQQGTIRDKAVYDAGQDDTNVVNHLTYDSFGNIASQSNPSQAPRGTFTGQHWDADAGMYYYGGRWYDGDSGQFVSAAPPPGSGAPANMGNPYAYASNSPTNLVVPTGAMPVPPPVGDMQVPSAAAMMQRGLMGMSPPSPQPTAGTSPGLGPRGLTAGGRRGMVDVMNDIDSGLGASTEAWRQEHIVYDQQVLADFQTRLPGWSVVVSAANLWNGHDMLRRELSTTDKIFDGLNVVGAMAGMGGATSAVDDVADLARAGAKTADKAHDARYAENLARSATHMHAMPVRTQDIYRELPIVNQLPNCFVAGTQVVVAEIAGAEVASSANPDDETLAMFVGLIGVGIGCGLLAQRLDDEGRRRQQGDGRLSGQRSRKAGRCSAVASDTCDPRLGALTTLLPSGAAELCVHRNTGTLQAIETVTAVAANDAPTPSGRPAWRRRASPKRWARRLLTTAMTVCFAAAGWLAWDQSRASPEALAAPAVHTASTRYLTKNIEDIRAGDLVLAADPVTGRQEFKTVLDAFQRESGHLRVITFASLDGGEQTLRTTDEHPFWVVDQGAFVNAGDLTIGDQVTGPDGELQVVTAAVYEPHPEGVAVFNFQVEDFHTYYVSAHGARGPPLLVHNADCVPPWKQYQDWVNNTYYGGTADNLTFTGKLSPIEREADNIVNRGTLAVESKRIEDWAGSIYNPASPVAQTPFALAERYRIVFQMHEYAASFKEVVYHTNSIDYKKYLDAMAQAIGAVNVTVYHSIMP